MASPDRLALTLLPLLASLLGGCAAESPLDERLGTQAPGAPDGVAETAGRLRLHGHVLSPGLVPVASANVSVVGLGDPRQTGADGAFDFGEVERRLYTVVAQAAGHLETSVTVRPDHEGAIRVVLQPGDPVVPYRATVKFSGVLECAFEALIISPSCDSALTAVPGAPALFDTNQSFLFAADRGWRTLVVDVVFDGEDHPGLDGLRIAVRGSIDADGGGEYVQYGRWHGPSSFMARLEPGGSYLDGTEPVPANATGFQVDVYPHSHAYHPAEQGFLGVGFAQGVRFDVFATLSYVEPAPAGWSFRQDGP